MWQTGTAKDERRALWMTRLVEVRVASTDPRVVGTSCKSCVWYRADQKDELIEQNQGESRGSREEWMIMAVHSGISKGVLTLSCQRQRGELSQSQQGAGECTKTAGCQNTLVVCISSYLDVLQQPSHK